MFGTDRCDVRLMNKSLEYITCNYRSACTDLLQNLLFPSAWYKIGMSFFYLKDWFSCTKLHAITSRKTVTLNKQICIFPNFATPKYSSQFQSSVNLWQYTSSKDYILGFHCPVTHRGRCIHLHPLASCWPRPWYDIHHKQPAYREITTRSSLVYRTNIYNCHSPPLQYIHKWNMKSIWFTSI